MDPKSAQSVATQAWALAARQHGTISRRQLLALGMSSDAIKHRLRRGRLHPTRWRGVYAVGRPHLTRYAVWMAAVLACGRAAVLSHRSAAALWEIRAFEPDEIEVSVPDGRRPRVPGVLIHRRARVEPTEITHRHDIPVTTPVQTLIDIATCLSDAGLEAAINDADQRDLVDPETLRGALDDRVGEPGVAIVRAVLDRRTLTLTDSELERRFLPLARAAGLPPPLTQHWVNGFRVDFYWPDLGLVVETDSLRYHRTAAAQTVDQRRDQAHTAAGLTPLRVSHAQVTFQPDHVEATLRRVARRLAGPDGSRARGRRRRAG